MHPRGEQRGGAGGLRREEVCVGGWVYVHVCVNTFPLRLSASALRTRPAPSSACAPARAARPARRRSGPAASWSANQRGGCVRAQGCDTAAGLPWASPTPSSAVDGHPLRPHKFRAATCGPRPGPTTSRLPTEPPHSPEGTKGGFSDSLGGAPVAPVARHYHREQPIQSSVPLRHPVRCHPQRREGRRL